MRPVYRRITSFAAHATRSWSSASVQRVKCIVLGFGTGLTAFNLVWTSLLLQEQAKSATPPAGARVEYDMTRIVLVMAIITVQVGMIIGFVVSEGLSFFDLQSTENAQEKPAQDAASDTNTLLPFATREEA